jgi:hypothetical protein
MLVVATNNQLKEGLMMTPRNQKSYPGTIIADNILAIQVSLADMRSGSVGPNDIQDSTVKRTY